MLSSYWLAVPFILQMACMAVDELWFHRRRGLPRWERIGHPLDALTVFACLAWALFAAPDRTNLMIFAALALFSCLFVTKDEHVHRRYCTASEQWLHAVLFLLHPVVLACTALLWATSRKLLVGVVRYQGYEKDFLLFMSGSILAFCFYQFLFWNVIWRPEKTAR